MSRYDRERARPRGDRDRERWRDEENRQDYYRDYGREDDERRGFFERAGDEVRAWFGDDEAERRRRLDDVERQREGRWVTNPSKSYGREYEREYGRRRWTREPESSRRSRESYGGELEDWRHLNNYWNDMYGEPYPGRSEFVGREWNRTSRSGSFTGRGPKNYRRSDERILEEINEQLTRHAEIDATDIEVTVLDGEVTLRGQVDSRRSKRMAEDVAEDVVGVKNVRNEIRVQHQSAA